MKHRVHINVKRKDMPEVEVLTSRTKRISARIARFLFGDYAEVLVLQPGKSVEGIVIQEMPVEAAADGDR